MQEGRRSLRIARLCHRFDVQSVWPDVEAIAPDPDIVRPGFELAAEQEVAYTRRKITVIVRGDLDFIAVKEGPDRIIHTTAGTDDEIGLFRQHYLEVIGVGA